MPRSIGRIGWKRLRAWIVAKVTDVVGLYLDPPARAIVLSVDEKTEARPEARLRRG